MGNGSSKPNKKYSVIIPALNEEQAIAAAVKSAQHPSSEVIVVDGGSHDGTIRNAKMAGASAVCTSTSGRAVQMNAGAAKASGRTLLFLHADSTLPKDFSKYIDESINRKHRWGCFKSIDISADVHPLVSKSLQYAVAMRTRLFGQPYGDQCIFVDRESFHKIGGYRDDYQLLEDVDLVGKLRNTYGRPAIIPHSLQTSGRRWKNLGFAKTTLVNQYILLQYAMGANVNQLAEMYSRMK